MTARVLFVDGQEETLAAVRGGLAKDCVLETACCVDEAWELCELQGPFACVVVGDELGGDAGVDFLGRVRARWPETVRMLVTDHGTYELAAQALQRGDVFRLLKKPLELTDLRRTLFEGLAQWELVTKERRLVQELRFAREALLDFTESLEARTHAQMERLCTLERLGNALRSARGIEEIGGLAREALMSGLGGRAVRLELCLPQEAVSRFLFEGGASLSPRIWETPISTPDGSIGTIAVDDRLVNGLALSEDERRLAGTVATAVGLAVENHVQRRKRDEAQHTTVFALARLAEHRDNETGLHLDRVREYCRLAALSMREDGHSVDLISDRFVDDIMRSSPLHDIGKVGIPDSILLKPGKLSDDEWVVMRTHTTIGADTLRSIIGHTPNPPSFLEMGLEIAWCHHERWDGSGYPRGLAGADIPLSARILSVADCYDALTSRRPYKEPWPHEKALAYLLEVAGTQFDPDVVDSFLKRSDEIDAIRERLRDEILAQKAG